MAPAILRYGSPGLRQVCRPAQPGHLETADLLDRLWESLQKGEGVGLAAPQIGDDRRVMVVRDPRPDGLERRLEIVNPVIEDVGRERGIFEEGCLSFPGLYLNITRPLEVVFTYADRDGRPHRLRDDGLVARIVQHEIDHLDGRLFIDLLPGLRRLSIAPWLWRVKLAGFFNRGSDRG